jgi:hypothetical protein
METLPVPQEQLARPSIHWAGNSWAGAMDGEGELINRPSVRVGLDG